MAEKFDYLFLILREYICHYRSKYLKHAGFCLKAFTMD
jgi:hypothetical protein